MAPEGLNVVAGNKRHLQYDDLMSLTYLSKSKKKKKKSAKLSSISNQKTPCSSNGDNDFIVIDSGNTCRLCLDSDNDIITLNNSDEEIVLNGSKSYPVCSNSDDNVVILDDSDEEIVVNSSKEELVSNENNSCVVCPSSDDDVIILNDSDEEIASSENLKNSDADVVAVQNVNNFNKNENNIVINIDPTCIDKIISEENSNVNDNKLITENGIVEETNEHENFRKPMIQDNDYPKKWTKKMIQFYTKPCERNRNFDYKTILEKLETNSSDWKINTADIIGPSRRRHYVQCRRCNRSGHIEKECTTKIVCYVCGGFNHVFEKCPNTLCLTCGKPTRRNIKMCDICKEQYATKRSCNLCGQLYHSEMLCPSKWRKYLILDSSAQPAKPNPRKFCYNCAKMGHFGFECHFAPYSSYPPENPFKTTLLNHYSQAVDTNNNHVMFISKLSADLLNSENGNEFLKLMSNNRNIRIEFLRGANDYIRIIGNETDAEFFKTNFHKWKSEIACIT